MNPNRPTNRSKSAFTLLEMSIVIMVLLALITIGLNVSTKITDWKLARAASETLRLVYSAQRMFLSDNPTKDVSTITEKDLVHYLRNVPQASSATTFSELQAQGLLETPKSLQGQTLSFLVNQSPPKFAVAGIQYDPSGSTTDSLWDVGL